MREETGLEVEIGGYLGTSIDVINVAYYTAELREAAATSPDPREVSEVAWFAWDELPPDLAPPGTLAAVLAPARTRGYDPGAQPPALTASRAMSSGPSRCHWLPAGSSVYALLRKR